MLLLYPGVPSHPELKHPKCHTVTPTPSYNESIRCLWKTAVLKPTGWIQRSGRTAQSLSLGSGSSAMADRILRWPPMIQTLVWSQGNTPVIMLHFNAKGCLSWVGLTYLDESFKKLVSSWLQNRKSKRYVLTYLEESKHLLWGLPEGHHRQETQESRSPESCLWPIIVHRNMGTSVL